MDRQSGQSSSPVAVVTGAARGIGAATCERLERDGYLVERCDIRWDAPARNATDLDVSSSDDWARFASSLRSRYDEIDVLVNNAGVSGRSGLLSTSEDEWARIIGTTLTGTWLGMRHLAPVLRPGGAIVNLGSVYGLRLPPRSEEAPVSPAYQAGKAAIHHLTLVAAQELADLGIRVNAVAPGFIETELVRSLPEHVAARRRSGAFLGRSGGVEEVADAIAFLVSESASFITGEVLSVAGGYHDEYSPSLNHARKAK